MSNYGNALYYVLRTRETDMQGFPSYLKRMKLCDSTVKVKLTQRWREAFIFITWMEAKAAQALAAIRDEEKEFDIVEVSVVMNDGGR